MIRPFILDNNEEDFLGYAGQKYRLDEEILRVSRRPVLTVRNLLLAETELGELRLQRDIIQEAMEAYDAKHNPGRKGMWMPMFSGKRFWPEHPMAKDIDIRDIAHSLARINRYNGHTKESFSVAQHSVLVSRLLPQAYRLFGLLHDAGESYLGDCITPVKKLFREFYEPLEENVMAAVAERFGFESTFHNQNARYQVKRADIVLLATEVRDLTTNGFITQPVTELPMDEPIAECWPAEAAERLFLNEFNDLYRTAA
jgi:5'-deoxynucleotidase YfbR-like HD superfamily hydrolase